MPRRGWLYCKLFLLYSMIVGIIVGVLYITYLVFDIIVNNWIWALALLVLILFFAPPSVKTLTQRQRILLFWNKWNK